MDELDFEQRNRLETEVLPAVIGDPEYAAATIVRLEAERDRLLVALKDADYCLGAWQRGAYAEDYAMDIADIRAAIAKADGGK